MPSSVPQQLDWIFQDVPWLKKAHQYQHFYGHRCHALGDSPRISLVMSCEALKLYSEDPRLEVIDTIYTHSTTSNALPVDVKKRSSWPINTESAWQWGGFITCSVSAVIIGNLARQAAPARDCTALVFRPSLTFQPLISGATVTGEPKCEHYELSAAVFR